MNAKNMKNKSHTDWKRIDAMKDEDIDVSDPDCIPMTEKQLKSSKFVVFQNGIKSTKEIHEAFEKKYGVKVVSELEDKKNIISDNKSSDYIFMIDYYKEKVKQLLKEKS